MERLATLLRSALYNAYGAVLVGDQKPPTKRYFKRTTSPEVGDLVVEISTIHGMRHAGARSLDGIGFLEEIAREKVDFGNPEFVWDEDAQGKPHPTETVFYIRTFDGRRFRWINATFIAAVTDAGRAALKEQTP